MLNTSSHLTEQKQKARNLQESVKVAAMQCADKRDKKLSKVSGMQIACKLRAQFLQRAAIR